MLAMFVNRSGRNEKSIEDLPLILPTMFRFIWLSSFREDVLEIDQQELPMVTMFVNGSGQKEQS